MQTEKYHSVLILAKRSSQTFPDLIDMALNLLQIRANSPQEALQLKPINQVSVETKKQEYAIRYSSFPLCSLGTHRYPQT